MGKSNDYNSVKHGARKANTNKIISKIVHNAKKETPRQHRKRLKETR